MSLSSLKLHNAMWPGLVGKGDDEGQEPPISLEKMLDFSAAAEINGRKFDGIDYFLFLPHTNPEASDDELKGIADQIVSKGFDIGSLVAPVWPGTVGDSAMGTDEQQEKFLDAVKMACRIAKVFNEHGKVFSLKINFIDTQILVSIISFCCRSERGNILNVRKLITTC